MPNRWETQQVQDWRHKGNNSMKLLHAEKIPMRVPLSEGPWQQGVAQMHMNAVWMSAIRSGLGVARSELWPFMEPLSADGSIASALGSVDVSFVRLCAMEAAQTLAPEGFVIVNDSIIIDGGCIDRRGAVERREDAECYTAVLFQGSLDPSRGLLIRHAMYVDLALCSSVHHLLCFAVVCARGGLHPTILERAAVHIQRLFVARQTMDMVPCEIAMASVYSACRQDDPSAERAVVLEGMVLEYLSRNRVARTLCLGLAPEAFPAEQVVLSLCSDSLQTERVWERISLVPGTNAENSQMLIQTTLLYGCVVSHCLSMYIRNDWTCRLRGLNPLINPIACTLSAMMQLHGEGFEFAFCRMEGTGLFPSFASVFRDKEGVLKPKVMEAVCFLAERITSASIVAAATVNHWVAVGLEERARAQCDTDLLSDELPQLWEEDQCLGEICHEQDSIWRL